MSPSACATQAPSTTVFVVISTLITATANPTYGIINGYTKANPDGTYGNVATVIAAKSTDIVQFVNGETTSPAAIIHSGIGFPNATAFPAVPYTFPASTQQPIGNAITQTQWSTGRIAPLCFSQPLSLSPGTYYFGDFDYYNLVNMRDAIVISP